eukprot:355261-Chlamydomonas_euryale.AAC.3
MDRGVHDEEGAHGQGAKRGAAARAGHMQCHPACSTMWGCGAKKGAAGCWAMKGVGHFWAMKGVGDCWAMKYVGALSSNKAVCAGSNSDGMHAAGGLAGIEIS